MTHQMDHDIPKVLYHYILNRPYIYIIMYIYIYPLDFPQEIPARLGLATRESDVKPCQVALQLATASRLPCQLGYQEKTCVDMENLP